MKTKILGLLAAGVLLGGLASPAEAQIRVHIPGTPINVNVGDRYDPAYDNNDDDYYYNRYNDHRGFWLDGNGYARWNSGYYTGWRGDVYYRNGQPYRYRDRDGHVRTYRVIW